MLIAHEEIAIAAASSPRRSGSYGTRPNGADKSGVVPAGQPESDQPQQRQRSVHGRVGLVGSVAEAELGKGITRRACAVQDQRPIIKKYMGIWLAVSTSLCDELAHRAVFTKLEIPPTTGIRSLGRMIRAASKALPVVFQVIWKTWERSAWRLEFGQA